jgi:hydrogenase small subunit
MEFTRRDFLKLATASAGVIGLSALELSQLEEALANPAGPTVLWLQGAGCTGCSVSLLNRVSATAPTSAGDLLINTINLAYHPNVMALAGQSAADVLQKAYAKGGYVLAVEGGVPTAFGGNTCWAYSYNGVDVTFKDALNALAAKASKILAIGTCASWGGVSAAPPNPYGVQGVGTATGRPVINIAGCPPHPDWVVWTIAQLILGRNIALDSYKRPTALYGRTVHDQCPRREQDETDSFGPRGCLKELGCRGPETHANCPAVRWNNAVAWCIGSNATCLGCSEPNFPGTAPFYRGEDDGDDH